MRYFIALLTAAIVILIGYAVWLTQQRNALPDVHIVEGGIYDGRTVANGAALVHTFKVENPHSFALGLEAPVASCACTTATVSASGIPAHGTAEVTLRVEPEDGKFSGSASVITTHGSKSAETWLIVTGKSLPAKTRTARQSKVSGFR